MAEAQSKKMSLVESIANVVVGFGIATGANYVVLPWFGYDVTWSDSAGIGLILTVVSLVRSYVLRRVFEWLRVNKS